jgi:hypothetical protein
MTQKEKEEEKKRKKNAKKTEMEIFAFCVITFEQIRI